MTSAESAAYHANEPPIERSGVRQSERTDARRRPLMGVLYAEDFDDDGPAPGSTAENAPEPELIEPVFTAAELDAARSEGRAAGKAESERGLAASRVQLLGTIASGVVQAQVSARTAAEQTAEATARCILTALVACLPSLCARHGATEIRALVRAVLPALVDEPKLTVRVNPHLVSIVESEITTLDFEITQRVQILGAEALAPGDARISWGEGSAVRDAGRARAAVNEALAMLDLLERDPLQPEMTDA